MDGDRFRRVLRKLHRRRFAFFLFASRSASRQARSPDGARQAAVEIPVGDCTGGSHAMPCDVDGGQGDGKK